MMKAKINYKIYRYILRIILLNIYQIKYPKKTINIKKNINKRMNKVKKTCFKLKQIKNCSFMKMSNYKIK